MRRRTKALQISKAVKDAVWERDGHCCIICGSPWASPCAHYISRAQGGLGIEENTVTLCPRCHMNYDQTDKRPGYRLQIGNYLRRRYRGWDESKLIYRKER